MGGQVTVACKLPNGLMLQLFEMIDTVEPVMGGGFRSVKMAQKRGAAVRIAGYAHHLQDVPAAPVVGGYALTSGVDADFFEEWLAQNREADYVRNKLVFAHERAGEVRAQARDQKDVTDNQGPIIPDKDPRIPTQRNREGRQVPAIETVEE